MKITCKCIILKNNYILNCLYFKKANKLKNNHSNNIKMSSNNLINSKISCLL